MEHCKPCYLPRAWCEHGRADRTAAAAASVKMLLVSPTGVAHFPGCPHKGDNADLSRWGELDTPHAWARLGNHEELRATGGSRPDRVASRRCANCVDHGPWR